MKVVRLSLLLACLAASPARADLTLTQDVQGAGPASVMTIKIKDGRARIDATSGISTIIDSRSGVILNLMLPQKQFVRVAAAEAKAAAEMALGADRKKAPPEKAKLQSTGARENINGYEADEYLCETPMFTARYWISQEYPDAAEIVKQLQTMTPAAWGSVTQGLPDYRDFPGLPLRSRIRIAGREITSTLTAVKKDALPESDFAVPAGFTEFKRSDLKTTLGGGKYQTPMTAPSPRR